jgi:hypothetical protein
MHVTDAAWVSMHVLMKSGPNHFLHAVALFARLTSVRQQSAGLLQQLHCSMLGDQKAQGVQGQRLLYLLLHILSYLVACF